MVGRLDKAHAWAAPAALGALLTISATPPATAQWAPPPLRAATPAGIEQALRAGGYVLVAPLQRRPTVYLADVIAGPAGRERLVIDAGSGEILERFLAPPRLWPTGFAGQPGGVFVEPLAFNPVEAQPCGEMPDAPANRPVRGVAYSAPDARVPDAIGPDGSPSWSAAPSANPKPAATSRKPAGKPAATLTAPLPPPRPRDLDASPDGPEKPAAPAPFEPSSQPLPGQTQTVDASVVLF